MGQDGYWYGFSNEGNSAAALCCGLRFQRRITPFTEGTETDVLFNANRWPPSGERDADDSFGADGQVLYRWSGYLYAPANDKKAGIYMINVSNPRT